MRAKNYFNFFLIPPAFTFPFRPVSHLILKALSFRVCYFDSKNVFLVQNHTAWRVTAAICSTQVTTAQLGGNTSAVFNPSSPLVAFNLSLPSLGRFHLCFSLSSEPSGYTAKLEMPPLDIFPVGYKTPTIERKALVRLRFVKDFSVIADRSKFFATAVFNKLAFRYLDVIFGDFRITKGKKRKRCLDENIWLVFKDAVSHLNKLMDFFQLLTNKQDKIFEKHYKKSLK